METSISEIDHSPQLTIRIFTIVFLLTAICQSCFSQTPEELAAWKTKIDTNRVNLIKPTKTIPLPISNKQEGDVGVANTETRKFDYNAGLSKLRMAPSENIRFLIHNDDFGAKLVKYDGSHKEKIEVLYKDSGQSFYVITVETFLGVGEYAIILKTDKGEFTYPFSVVY